MCRALLYSREGLFSLGVARERGVPSFSLGAHSNRGICSLLPSAQTSPFSPSAPFYCKPSLNKDKSSLAAAARSGSLSRLSISSLHSLAASFVHKKPKGLLFPLLLPPQVFQLLPTLCPE